MKYLKCRSFVWLAVFLLITGAVVSFGTRHAEAAVPAAPVVKSFEYNFTYDFLEELEAADFPWQTVDDAEIIWQAVEGATHYKVEIHYNNLGSIMDEFIIPGSDVIGGETIIDLGNGDLKFIWVDYRTNHPTPVAQGMVGITMKAINTQGESERSNEVSSPSGLTVLYGQVTNALTGVAVQGAKIDLKKHVRDNYGDHEYDIDDVYTDEKGMYYVGGLSYNGAAGPQTTYLFDVFHPQYESGLDYSAEFNDGDEQIRIDIELVKVIPDAPVVDSLEHNFTHDFLEDLVTDDVEIVWGAVEAATHYRVEIHYIGRPEPDDSFIIPGNDVIGGETIIDLGNGDLKFIWIDYLTNHPTPVAWGMSGITMKAINPQGESERSNLVGIPSPDTVLYGQVMNASTGVAIQDARIDLRKIVTDNYGYHEYDVDDVYTDEKGMYYVGALSYNRIQGPQTTYYFDVSHPQYEPSLDHSAAFNDGFEQIRIDVELEPLPDTQSPVISNVSPRNRSTTTNRRKAFHAEVSDNVCLKYARLELDDAEVSFKVNGQEVTDSGHLNGTEATIGYTPSYNLSYGQHTYYIVVWDTSNNTRSYRTRFTVERGDKLPIPTPPRPSGAM